ncbi:Type IV secretion system protein VirD4 OS=Sphingobium scionense OX=1404341 GN=GGQ90_003452 PE=3 SV=1 [Sphingobium scionense]
MAGYGLKAFLIAQSLNQIEKAYGPNNAILDNCHVRVSFATNDERTAKRVSDALGTATEMRAMKNYAGHRLSPWLGHLMVSRSETARQLLTPGEVMQLPPDDEIVMVAGVHPIRAKKARYFQDRRLSERIMQAPASPAAAIRPDDWTGRQVVADPKQVARIIRDAEDAANGGLRREPELPEHVAIVPETPAPAAQEFSIVDDEQDDAARQAAVRRRMQGIARQASLDPGDGIEL